MRVKNWLVAVGFLALSFGCNDQVQLQPAKHPDTKDWQNLFTTDLTNAQFPAGVWSNENGVLTATEDQNIWTIREYDNFMLDLEFKTADGTNSGVVVYCSDKENWIPNAVEIQIADDYAKKWAESLKTWQCAAFFGHKPATHSVVKKPGEWNHYTITCKDSMIYVLLNGEQVNEIDLSQYTSATQNPDGSEIPSWLSRPWAELATKGYIGLQGKHAGAPIYFRNIKIKEIE